MRKGARILAVDGQEVQWWGDFDQIMGRKADVLAADCSHEDSVSLRQLPVVFINEGAATPDTATLMLDENYMLGIVKLPYQYYYKDAYVHRDYGFWESIPAGIAYGWETLKGYVSDLKYVFTKKGAQSVGSFGTIGNLFPAVWDWASFWNITAFISIILAVMNILPIPGLDGGHIFFLLVEAITRRPPAEKFMERAQYVGMALLFALMALALFNDAVKFLF
jgi:regulator of sigma E protease